MSSLLYQEDFLQLQEIHQLENWLMNLHPIWERISKPGDPERWLLRPVYWLGHWQFAALGYFHPPQGCENRCVRAEPFPPFLQEIVGSIERCIRDSLRAEDVPKHWKLNTLLINYYGSKKVGDQIIDCARVGEHRDFEPGPVASLSFGEKALFQFVKSQGKHQSSRVIWQKWLAHGSLQAFAGSKWKRELFHRVQRVDHRSGRTFPLGVADFSCRRINLTFRYVPEEYLVDFKNLPAELLEQVRPYVEELSGFSDFFHQQMKGLAGFPMA